MKSVSCEIETVSREMKPVSREIETVSREMKPVSREIETVSREMKPVSREIETVSRVTGFILRFMATVSRETAAGLHTAQKKPPESETHSRAILSSNAQTCYFSINCTISTPGVTVR
jgi:hypothetical protein